MTRYLTAMAAGLVAAALAGASPPAIPPADAPPAAVKASPARAAGPKFPDFPAPKPPAPAPSPAPAPRPNADDPVKLGPGQYLVVTSGRPLLILSHGKGEATVTEWKPPFMLPVRDAVGQWPVGKDTPGFVRFTDPFIYAVEAKTSGPVTLTVIPAVNEVGDDGKQVPLKAADITRKSLLVDDGTAPVPPTPVDPPGPAPIPNPAKGFRVLMVWEKQANLTKEQLNVANSSRIAAYLNAKCVKGPDGRPEWRKWDASTVDRPGGLDRETPVWRQLWSDARPKLGPLPQVVIVTDQAGVTLPWEATEDAMLALLQKYGG